MHIPTIYEKDFLSVIGENLFVLSRDVNMLPHRDSDLVLMKDFLFVRQTKERSSLCIDLPDARQHYKLFSLARVS